MQDECFNDTHLMGRVQFAFLVTFLISFSGSAFAADPNRSRAVIPAEPFSPNPIPVSPELESKIVELFSTDQCATARTLVSPNQFGSLRPLVLAVIAYCQPAGFDPEELFERAEKREPSNDTIVVLHARYRFKKDPDSALELWKKVLLLVRTPNTRQMAQEYLAGNGEAEEQISVGQKLTYYLSAQFGGSFETNPAGNPASSERQASGALNTNLSLGILDSTFYGYFALNYALANSRYFSAHDVDLFEHDLESPISLRVGTNEDLILRPFVSYLTLGDSPYQLLGGLSVQGIAYRSQYKQYVQGSIFQDHFYPGNFQSQQGTHFRFDYNWEFYPENFFIKFVAYFEHVNSDQDSDLLNSLSIPYSHNDLGFQGYFDYNLKFAILGLYPKILIREDDDASTFLSASSGAFVSKRRQDFQISVQPHVIIPLISYLQLYIYYEINRTYSNIGIDDYQDRNILNQTVGIALRTFVANLY